MKNIVDSYSRNFIDVVCRGEWRVALPLVCPADLMCPLAATAATGTAAPDMTEHRGCSCEGRRGNPRLELELELELVEHLLGLVILRVASKQAN
jgi:hypothetical protein